jgi:hypothetical protein
MHDGQGAEVPPELQEETRASIDESMALIEKWNGEANGEFASVLRHGSLSVAPRNC